MIGYTCSLIASVPPGTPGELFITNSGVYFYGKSLGSEAKVYNYFLESISIYLLTVVL